MQMCRAKVLKIASVMLLISRAVAAADLRTEFERIARGAGGRVGVSAVLVETGEHAAFEGSRAFFMASVVKFPVALAVLHLVDTGKLTLDQEIPVYRSDLAPGAGTMARDFRPGAAFTIRDLMSFMILASDNTACDVLMRVAGGPQAIMARVQALGIRNIRIDRTEKQLAADYRRSRARFLRDPRDTSTPDAMAALLAKFQQGETLQPASTTVLRDLMEQTTLLPNRLKGLLPPGTVVGHKTGTYGRAAINDVGIITLPGAAKHIAIAVFTNGSNNPDPVVEHAIAEIGRAAYDHWAQ